MFAVVQRRRKMLRGFRGTPDRIGSWEVCRMNSSHANRGRRMWRSSAHNGLSILKCSDVLHYNKNVTRALCVRALKYRHRSYCSVVRSGWATLVRRERWSSGVEVRERLQGLYYNGSRGKKKRTTYREKTIFGHKEQKTEKPHRLTCGVIYAQSSQRTEYKQENWKKK